MTDRQAADLALELFVVGYEGQELPAEYAEFLQRGLAGAILFRRNLSYSDQGVVDLDHLVGHTAAIHAAGRSQPSQLPVICSVDQEGGAVARLKAPFTVLPPMRRLGERGDADLVRRVGQQLGRELRAAGFNVDYAPVLDVDTNPANPIIGDRSFSRDPHEVARLAGALLQGLQSAGVLGCGKHFPGHGDTAQDSHLELPSLPHDLQRLRSVELVPFAKLANELQLVMTAHVLFPALDATWPATLSPQILLPLLRVACGYQGVIVSDDLEMRGVANVLDAGGCVRRGLQAGCDLFLVCRQRDTLQSAWQAAQDILAGPPDAPLRRRALDAIGRARTLRAGLQPVGTQVADLRALLSDSATLALRAELAAGTL
ncbi:MAG: beta-N-acetylhexosaminidase [Deltaproteobacteria bacterium]|nr:beta-N-acetylhexosaminidase [Deltaproteobacteria bacterium]